MLLRPWNVSLIPFAACAVLLAVGCDNEGGTTPPPPTSAAASTYSSSTLVAWYEELYEAIRVEALSPPAASRVIGYTGVATYEAIAPGMDDHNSLAGQLNGLTTLPDPEADVVYHWPSAANAAAARVILGLVPTATDPTVDAINALEAAQETAFTTSVPADVRARSIDFGRDIADAILAWASTDGFGTLATTCPAYVELGTPGSWAKTPPAFANPLQPCWGTLRTFVIDVDTSCPIDPPPPYSTVVDSQYRNELQEVYDTVNNITPEQDAIARFWADGPGATGTPPGHWISIACQIATAESHTLDVCAEAMARVGISVADAFIACWKAKYEFNYIRPITAVADDATINDDTWAPILPTPPFPEYPSGHSVQSGAACEALTAQFGPAFAFTDDTHADRDMPARSFPSFVAAANEAAISRLYGGIHFRAAIDDGIAQGACIGQTIAAEVDFLK